MAYITNSDFRRITGEQEPDNFEFLELRASNELDAATNHYFQYNELKDDFVGRKFKTALALQILFFMEAGTASSEKMNDKPDSVRIGQTTVSYNRTGSGAESSRRQNALSQDALNTLKGTGLLYRGVRHV